MTHTLIGVVFILAGLSLLWVLRRGSEVTGKRAVARVDPSVFAVMDLRAPDYRAKPAVAPSFPKIRRSSLGLEETGREGVSSMGLGETSREEQSPGSAPGGKGLRISQGDDPAEGGSHNLGL